VETQQEKTTEETPNHEVQERFTEIRKIYRAKVVYYSMSGEASITLYTQAGGFELARSIFNGTTWMRDRHGRIAAITEVAGVWVE
jgi:hypothetical protein